MSLAAAVAGARLAAERLMVDACTVARPTAPSTASDGTVTTGSSSVYTGACKVQTYEGHESNPIAGEHSFTVQRYRVDFPVDAFDPAPGDVVTITTGTYDAGLVGKSYRVAAVVRKSQASAMRCHVDEVVA